MRNLRIVAVLIIRTRHGLTVVTVWIKRRPLPDHRQGAFKVSGVSFFSVVSPSMAIFLSTPVPYFHISIFMAPSANSVIHSFPGFIINSGNPAQPRIASHPLRIPAITTLPKIQGPRALSMPKVRAAPCRVLPTTVYPFYTCKNRWTAHMRIQLSLRSSEG